MVLVKVALLAVTAYILAPLIFDISSGFGSSATETEQDKSENPQKSSFEKYIPAFGAWSVFAALGSKLIGFATGGIVGGSLASIFQAIFGAGFFFSLLQSFGARGLFGPTGIISLLAFAGVYMHTQSKNESTVATIENSKTPETPPEIIHGELSKGPNLDEGCYLKGTNMEVCNGHGTCKPGSSNGKSFCQCESGFSGIHCETKLETHPPEKISTRVKTFLYETVEFLTDLLFFFETDEFISFSPEEWNSLSEFFSYLFNTLIHLLSYIQTGLFNVLNQLFT